MTTTRKPVILFDVDGVLVDFNATFLKRINEEFGLSLSVEDITDFGYSCLTSEQRKRMYEHWHSFDLYDNASLSLRTLQVINELRTIARVVACTSPLAGHVHSKFAFLSRYFAKQDIILASDKAMVHGHILVDDGSHNIEAFPGVGIVFDQPWNRSLKGYPRARDIEEAGALCEAHLLDMGLVSYASLD